jgi:nucleotide-binding universal stress UspA family protein
MSEEVPMFRKILHANDGSDHASKALDMAIGLAKRDAADLHMICVEELPDMPEFIEEIRETRGTAARRFHTVVQRARVMAERAGIGLQSHVLAGHPVRTIVDLAGELHADLLVIGATGHSALYVRTIGSRADRIIQLAPCPVLVVK